MNMVLGIFGTNTLQQLVYEAAGAMGPTCGFHDGSTYKPYINAWSGSIIDKRSSAVTRHIQ